MFKFGDFSLLFTMQYRSHKSKTSFKCHICIWYFWETPNIALFGVTVGWHCKTPINKKKSTFLTVTHLTGSSKEQEHVCRCSIVTTWQHHIVFHEWELFTQFLHVEYHATTWRSSNFPYHPSCQHSQVPTKYQGSWLLWK